MSDLSDIWAGTTFETRDERKARLMSDPTTAETPTMRDRLARAAAFQDPRCKRVNNTPMPGPMHYAQVDMILTELEQPSEAMIEAMMRGFSLQESPHVAMRDALVNLCHFIRNGG